MLPESGRNLPLSFSCFQVINEADRYVVRVDTTSFQPEELRVSVCSNQLIIEGHHAERNEQTGTVERHFVRKYYIPDDVLQDTLVSHVDGAAFSWISIRFEPLSCLIPCILKH